MESLLQSSIEARPEFRENARQLARRLGYETTHWVRVVMYQRCFAFIRSLGEEQLDVLEVSGGSQWRREFNFRSYEATHYPEFDICSETLPRQFDLIIADQIFEHLAWPYRAGRNVYSMLKPGGHFIIATPFLLKLHDGPLDCSRWSESGLSHLLQECGFPAERIKTDSWGNRACIVGNLNGWRRKGFFGSLKNEKDFPVMVWAFAQKPLGVALD
jgi:SAM-dependent methyltransferase